MTALLEAVHTPATVEKLLNIQNSIREVATATGGSFSGKVHDLDYHINDYRIHLENIGLIPEGLFYQEGNDKTLNEECATISEKTYRAVSVGQGDWFVPFYDVGLLLFQTDAYLNVQVTIMLSRLAGIQSRITTLLEAWGENDYWHRY